MWAASSTRMLRSQTGDPQHLLVRMYGNHWISVCLMPVNLVPQMSAWGQPETFAGVLPTSGVGGRADEIRAKAEVAARMSVVGGRPDLPRAWLELRFLARFGLCTGIRLRGSYLHNPLRSVGGEPQWHIGLPRYRLIMSLDYDGRISDFDTTLSDALRRSQRPNGYTSYSSIRPSCRAILAES